MKAHVEPSSGVNVEAGRGRARQIAYVTFLAGTAALGGFLFGFDSAVINGAVGGIQRSFRSSSAGTGFAVASILLGCALGALGAGRLADRLGRRPAMLITAVVFAGTSVWAALARTTHEFTIARFVSGIAVGAASVVCPAYIAEVSPARLRGRLASLQQLGIVLGIFAALLSDEVLARAAGGVDAPLWGRIVAWRSMFIVEVVPSLVFGIALLTVPESPRYLVAAGRDERALAVLRRIEPATRASDVDEIRRTLHVDRPPHLADLLGDDRRVLPIVRAGVGLAVLQQFVGINSVFYYGGVLWESVGFTTADSLRINVVTGLVNVVATFVAMALIDRAGRRPLLLAGSAGMAVTLCVLAVALSRATLGPSGHIELSHGTGTTALVAANLYVFAFGVSWGPCVWVLLGEMFPNAVRGAALAVAVFAQWIANWVVTVSFPPVVAWLGPAGAYGAYFAFAVLSFVFVLSRVRETRGRVLEEM
jgi:SP family sugar:H+ symporter-like MFS transporter